MNQKQTAFVTKELMLRAVKDSFVKLAPKTQLRNPVMFLVYVSAVLTTALYVCSLFGVADARPGFILAVAVILWFTVLFADFAEAIAEAPIHTPVCPIYQNVDAKPRTDPAVIRENLIAQLTAPVRWTYIVKNMLADGVGEFTELGPGTVLQGLIRKVDAQATVESKSAL